MTDNATISASHTVIMEEFDEDVLENEERIANVKRCYEKDAVGMLLILGTGNGSLGTSVQRQPS